ncbi:MAG: DUF2066 domain-containing protein [Alphaproteobacteria bacterium]
MIDAQIGKTFVGAVLLFVAVAAMGPVAGAQEIFTVRNVAVDVTANNAAAARERALAEGQIEASRQMLARVIRRQDRGNLPLIDDDMVNLLVSNFSIAKERTSNVRYLAELTVRFDRNAVRDVLRDASLPFAETVSKPVLVLPILRGDAGLLLWDEPNPWRDAWGQLPSGIGALVPMEVPLGDLSDFSDISAEQAADGDLERLNAIAARYGADDSLVVIATLDEGISGRFARVDVAVTRVGATTQAPILLDLAASAGQDLEALLRLAAIATADAVEDAWIEDHLLRFDQEQVAYFSIPLSGLDDWLEVRERLGRVALIAETQLRQLRREKAEIAVRYFGELAQLEDALVQRDLIVDDVQGERSGLLAPQDSPRTLRLAAGR